MKVLPDGTIEVEADGTIYISKEEAEKGTRFPFKCPECGSFFPWSDATNVVCPKCGTSGDPAEFSEARFEIEPSN